MQKNTPKERVKKGVLGFTQNGGRRSEKNGKETRLKGEDKEAGGIKERANTGM